MRLPLLPSDMTQPFCVIIVHDKATNVPAFAFSNYGIGSLDTDQVKLDEYTLQLVLQVEDLQYSEVRPNSLGIGMHRREATFTIRNNGPFVTAPFAAGLYSAGVNTDKFYFSIWVTDFKLSLKNLRTNAIFLGYFDLDAGIGWDESSLTTNIKLVDRLTNLTGRYASNTEAAENILQGSEWQRILQEPAYLGYRGSVPAYGRMQATIGGFDSYQDSVLAVVAGIVTSSTLSGTSIQLGKSPSLSQFINKSVKLKMGNGCIVQGNIRDLGGGEYGLDTTGLSLNIAWDTIKCFNRGWTAIGDELRSNEGGADLSSIFLEGGLTPPSVTDSALTGTATASDGSASEINDNSEVTKHTVTAGIPVWFKIDFGSGNAKMIGKIKLNVEIDTDTSLFNFQVQGSNDDSAWDVLYTGSSTVTTTGTDQFFTFIPPTQTTYRYIRLYVTSRSMAATKTGLYALGLYAIEVVPGGTALDKLPSPSMYVKTNGPVELYSGGVVTTAGPLFCKLTGVKDDANKELGCEPLKDPANPFWKFGGISVEFDAATPSANFSDVDLLHLNYAIWLDKGTYGIYFTDKTYVLADIQKSGMPWELIVTKYMNTGMTIEHKYYIKLAGPTTIAESVSGQYAIYATDGQKMVVVPNADIDSIVYDCGDFSLPDLCCITLKRSLTDINESFDPNLVYVDTYPPMHGAEVMAFIMNEAGIGAALRDKTLTTGTATLGNPLGVVLRDETWSELLDSVVFESGLQIDTMYGYYTARASFTKSVPFTFNNTTDPTQTFQYINTDGTLAFADVIDGTYKMNIGKMYTNVENGREFIRVHYTYDFVYSNFNGERKRKLQSTRAAKSNDRIISYTFKHVVDTATATAAAQQMQRIGHAANIPESMRIVDIGMPFSYLSFQVLDTVRLVDFRHITRSGDPIPEYNDLSATNPVYSLGYFGPYYKYTDTIPYALIPGIGIIDSINFNFSGSGIPVSIIFKQMQVNTTSNLRAVAERVEVLNDADENTSEGATGDSGGGSAGYPGQGYRCPPGTELQNVVIVPGEVKPSSTTTYDPCCNSSTVVGDIVSDPMVTVICVGVCDNPEGCEDDDWPTGCVGAPFIQYEPHTDKEIGNSESLLFDLIFMASSVNVGCPTLISINYPGKVVPDTCVAYVNKCAQFNAGNVVFGLLIVNPCVFNTPANQYSKGIELVFDVPYCEAEFSADRRKVTLHTRVKRVHIVIPVSLRPVSDINVG